MSTEFAVLLVVILVVAAAGGIVALLRTRMVVATPTERAVHSTLHTASQAARSLRDGLTETAAAEAAPHLRTLTGGDLVALFDGGARQLVLDGSEAMADDPAVATCCREAAQAALDGQRQVLLNGPLGTEHPLRTVIAAPLTTDDLILGILVVGARREPGPGMLGATAEVTRYVASQLELAELDASRARLDRAEVLALRAQISPHFIYNALNTIASFVRTDPDRARELILDFADFTRYSFRAAGEYTVLADELRNINRYLALERARFGESLQVRLQIAPEVLPVVVPFLALQPLVENAVRHGLAGRGSGTITIVAADAGTDCLISVEDDGVGMDPELLRTGAIDALEPAGPAESDGAHVGLTNVDHRLRAAFGNDYGLVIETAVGAGTKVRMRIPKFRPGIHATGSPATDL